MTIWLWLAFAPVLLLVALVLFTRVHQWRVERRYPPVGRFVRAGADDLHLLEAGAGTPVVMIHGASSNLREWTASIFDDVAARHHAIAIDRPGFGWSTRRTENGHDPRVQARLCREVFRDLGLERPILVAHSWAGALALAHALEFPQETGGILFLSGVSHPWPGGVGWEHEAASLPVLGRLFAWTLVAPGYFVRVDAGIRNVFRPNHPPDHYRESAATALYSRPATFLANADDLTRLKPIVREMAPNYPLIDTPLIALTGDEDHVILTELHTPPLVAKVPDAELEVLPGVGHMPHHVAPETVLAAIDQLVRQRRSSHTA
ncbi:alpha/beta fold hydrolase [Dichotomicrobium thermohalophilum]|uniref:alpha/beta fold hydrolase n=1 Tax=Dichotomicrobium thermohalophilum TaxID=933063 RepID=UPI000E5B39C6|nr:alpha/beta hydrolase [Dichotomicrobium thermohalophilum]